MTTVECEIIAEVIGAKMLYTCNFQLNSPFTKNYKIKPNYSSPFSEWYWIGSDPSGFLRIPSRFRVDFIREGIDLGLKNSSGEIVDRIIVEVPKNSYVGLWNFSMFVGLKNIEFRGEFGYYDSYILLIADFTIKSYERIYMIDYPLAVLWLLNLILIFLFAAVAFKCESRLTEKKK